MALFSNADEKEVEKRKQELDRLAAELERREADVSRPSVMGKRSRSRRLVKNWPLGSNDCSPKNNR